MTLIQVIDEKRMDIVVKFALYLREGCEFSVSEIEAVFAKPWKWEKEFADWATIGYMEGNDCK